jgi:hypothetical protein
MPGTMPSVQPPKRRVGRIIGIILGVMALLAVMCCGGVFIFGRDYISQGNAKLTTPDKVAGLNKSTQPDLQTLADEMAASLSSSAKLDKSIAVFYEDPAARNKIVMLAGGTRFMWQPKKELDSAFKGAEQGGLPISGISDVDAGKMGGTARCGTAKEENIAMSVCAWADHGSLVIGVFFNRPVAESADLLRRIRAEVLQR